MIVVLRLGHRPHRDERLTTHVCLVARAFGADGCIIADIKDTKVEETIAELVKKWGGNFWVKSGEDALQVLKNWKGVKVHLTMKGEPVNTVLDKIQDKNILVIVGSQKVPEEFYRLADYNVAIGKQPHSEAAALAVFLDRLFKGSPLI